MFCDLGTTSWFIWEGGELTTLVTRLFVEMALLNTMIGHIFSYNSEATTLNTGLDQFVAFQDVLGCLRVLVDGIASRVGTFEFQILEVVLDVSMDSSKFDILISLALFRAVTVILSPWINTIFAEQGLATVAFERIFDDHGTDGAYEEVCLFFDPFVVLNQIGDIQTKFVILWFRICSWGVAEGAIWIL